MTLDSIVKGALTNVVNAAKLDLETATAEVKRLETKLEEARKVEAGAQDRYKALYRYLADNS